MGLLPGQPREEGSTDMSQLALPHDEGSNSSCAETGNEEGGCECGSWTSSGNVSDRGKAE